MMVKDSVVEYKYQISKELWASKKRHGYACVTADGYRAILQYNPTTGATELHKVWVLGLPAPRLGRGES